MIKDFETQIKEKTDNQLSEIYLNANDYQPEFVKLVELELLNRKIPIDSLNFIKAKKEEISEKTIKLVIDGKNDYEILAELEKDGLPNEIGQKILDKAKTEINKVKGKAHREVAGQYFLKGIGVLALGAVVTGITYSMASGGGTYVVTSGLFAVGGIYVIIGVFKFLSNL